MADLVVGLSKVVVAGTLARVESAILEDAQLRQKAESDLVLITLEFEMMQSFLNVASEAGIKNNLVKTWVRHVRELAYDVEDHVEFVVHLDNKPVFWRRLQFHLVPLWMPCCKAPPLPLDEAVAKLGVLKARAKELSKCYLRYSQITDSAGSKLAQPASSAAAVGASALDMLVEARDAATRSNNFVDFAKLIAKKGSANFHLQTVAVWGSAGDLGKTSIIRKVYNDSEMHGDFGCRAWVKITHPFKYEDFIRHFMAQVYANSPREKGSQVDVQVLKEMKISQRNLRKKFLEEVNKRFFVVLEDLSSMVDWDAIRTFLPDKINGSWIVVSTQQVEIASLCVGRSYQVIELDKFSEDHSVYAFFNEGSQDDGAYILSRRCQSREARDYENDEDISLIGRQTRMTKLRKLIESFSDFQVVSVWGINGVGKSTLVKSLYHTMKHDKLNQFDDYRWVDVSRPLDLGNLCRNLIGYSHSTSDIVKSCRQLLQQHSWLVVIDDLRSKEEWDLINSALLSESSKGVIIVITTEEIIARHCCPENTKLVFNAASIEENEEIKVVDEEDGYSLWRIPWRFSQRWRFVRTPPVISPPVSVYFTPTHVIPSKGSQDDGSNMLPERCQPREASDSPNDEDVFLLGEENYEYISLIGRVAEMNELRIRVSSLFSFQVLSVWGITGVGKSSLIKSLIQNIKFDPSYNFDGYHWVNVSHPFDVRNFRSSLLQHSHSFSDDIRACEQLREEHRRLIVIDDLQSKEEWDVIKPELLSESSQSIIIVITTEASIAQHCCAYNDVFMFRVTCLEDEAATELFDRKVQMNNNPAPLSWLHNSEELRELILRCGGLPKVIVATACLLATKTLTWMDTVSSLNGSFIQQVETNPEFYCLRDLFGWMRSILHNSSDSIKPCILYLSIFPRNHIIRRKRLMRRWIAEGYCRDKDGKFAEEEAKRHFSELLELAIIQQAQRLTTSTLMNDTKTVQCQGFIREYIVSQGLQENLVLELGGSCALNTLRAGRHLIILKSYDGNRIVFDSIDFSRLRSMTVLGKWKSFFISEGMKVLRVLDLEDASKDVTFGDLEKIGKHLRRLKFLSLRGHSEIYFLPPSLGNLRQLQTLDVWGTSIAALPPSITKLQKLQYICAGRGTTVLVSTLPVSSSCLAGSWIHPRRVGVWVPPGMGRLTGLHTLGVVNVAASRRNSVLEELEKLTQLRKLGVSGINAENSTKFLSAIKGHFHLDSLSVRLEDNNNNQGFLADMVTLPPLDNLWSLKLYGLGNKLPAWGESHRLSKLTQLDLEMTALAENDINFLGKLPRLCILRVKQLQDGELNFRILTDGKEEESYRNIKVLQVACGSDSMNLHVTFGSKTMKELELLIVDCCDGSPQYEFINLKGLRELKEVLLLRSSGAENLRQELHTQLESLATSLKRHRVVKLSPRLPLPT
ncbi:unnamed protein product [Alopecurus aequalis]